MSTSPAEPRPPRLHSLRGRLVLLVLVVLAPAILSAALLLRDMDQQARKARQTQLVDTARALSLVVDREIGAQAAILQALSASRPLRAGDWEGFRQQAAEASADPQVWIVVNDKTGRQLVNTRAAAGAVLPVTTDAGEGIRWGGRQTGGVKVSNVFQGAVSGKPVFVVQQDVRLNDGRVVELAVTSEARRFQKLFADQHLPQSWTSSIVDAEGRVVARNRDIDRFIGRQVSPQMRQNMTTGSSGVAKSQTLDGIYTFSAWNRLPASGWAVIVGVPRSELASTAVRSLRWGVITALALLAVGLAVALWVARSIARPVEALAEAARSWGDAKNVPLAPTGIAETDELAVALARAVRSVDARESELRELNETLEARVQHATESLIQAQRLEAVGRLTGGVAHDFNNILMVATSGLKLIERTDDPEKRRNLAEAVKNALDRGASLTRQLLTFARRDALQPETLDLEQRLEGMRVLLDRSLREDVEVSMHAEPGLWPVRVDPVQLEVAVLNIAVNARDAMPSGGRIRIHMQNRPDSDAGDHRGDHVEIAIADSGVGMDAATLERVFEPFFTTKDVGKGTGLGLSQVYGFARSAGGGVVIESEPGKGSVVRLLLPRADEAPAAKPPAPVRRRKARSGRVLVVEDDAAVAGMVLEMVRSLGYETVHAPDAEAALSVLAEDRRIQLVFSDMVMPGTMNGADLAREITVRRPDLPVVLTTGYSDAAGAAAEAGFRLLPKPYDPEALAVTLDEALARTA